MSGRSRTGIIFPLLVLFMSSCGGGSGNSVPPSSSPLPASDFALMVETSTVATQQGGILQLQTIQASPLNGFTGLIALTLSGLPTGVTASSGPLSISLSGQSQGTAFQLGASRTALLGTTTVKVTGTSGAITHMTTFSLTVTSAAPFAINVSPGSVSMSVASTATILVSAASNPGTSPQLMVSVTGPPTSSQVNINSPQLFVRPTNPLSFFISASVLAQPLQNFPVAITASDDFNNTSMVTLPLTVTVPFASNTTPTRSTFVRTDKSPTGMVYDRSRKLLFVSVEVLNEVEVISTVDGHEVATIPVSFPAAIDEAADGGAVYVVSPYVGGVTIIDPNILQVIGRASVPQSVSGVSQPMTFIQIAALSNGKVVLYPTFDMVDLTKPPFYLWDPQTDVFTQFGPASFATSVGLLTVSADRSKLLSYQGIPGGGAGILYDVTTDSFVGPSTAISGFPAINPDGSQIVSTTVQNSSPVLAFYDRNFKLLAVLPTDGWFLGGSELELLYSFDGKELYVIPNQGSGAGNPDSVALVIDTTTFSIVGLVPSFLFGANLPFSGQWFTTFAVDETDMVFGAAFGGVGFLDMNSPTFLKEYMPGPFQIQPELVSLSSPTLAQLNGTGFSQDFTFNLFVGQPPALPHPLQATNISVQSANSLNLEIPAGSAPGPANATLTRSDGFFEVMPDAVSFGPTILRVDADAGSPSGNDSIKIIGYGLDAANTQVTIGGKLAATGQTNGAISGQLFPTESLVVTTPPGNPGVANVTVSTQNGSSSVPDGFQYLNSVQVYPLVGALDAVTYDQLRQRLYVTNEDHNQVEIFDLTTRQFLTPIPVGHDPTALALTPDSGLLAVVNRSDGTTSVIDPARLAVKATYPLLTAADLSCGGLVLNISPAEPHRMLVDVQCTDSLFRGLFHLIDLDSGLLGCTGVAGCSSNGTDINFGTGLASMASTSDGTKIFLASQTGGGLASDIPVGMLDLVANTLNSGFAGNFGDSAVNADGTVFAANFAISDVALRRVGVMAFEPYADSGSQSFHNVFGEKLNPSGSLLFYPQDSGVTIFDVHTGRLVRHVVLPDPIPLNTNSMVLDETGTKMFLTSDTGITIAQLYQAPLSLAALSSAAGGPGSTVTLRGSGFQAGTTVTFGANLASATFVDSNTLQATVPTLPSGSVRITLKNPDGHQYYFDDAFFVN